MSKLRDIQIILDGHRYAPHPSDEVCCLNVCPLWKKLQNPRNGDCALNSFCRYLGRDCGKWDKNLGDINPGTVAWNDLGEEY